MYLVIMFLIGAFTGLCLSVSAGTFLADRLLDTPHQERQRRYKKFKGFVTITAVTLMVIFAPNNPPVIVWLVGCLATFNLCLRYFAEKRFDALQRWVKKNKS